jgi:hypothetical protein
MIYFEIIKPLSNKQTKKRIVHYIKKNKYLFGIKRTMYVVQPPPPIV